MSPFPPCPFPVFLAWILIATAHATSSSNLSAILPITASCYGTCQIVEIQIGGQPFNVSFDTGSANLYIVQSGYECHSLSNTSVFGPQVPTAQCDFADNAYHPSSTFEPLDSEWMGINYASGNVVGPAGQDTVVLGNLSIPRQLFGLANGTSAGLGNPAMSGLMGLAWPGGSFVHPSTFTAMTSSQLYEKRLLYDTVSDNVGKYAAMSYFALAIERTPLNQESGFGGYLSFGTLPLVASGEFARTPVEITKSLPSAFNNGTGAEHYTFWSTTVQSTSWAGKKNNTPYQAIIDSGTPTLALPASIAEKINADFDPPGVPWASGPLQGGVEVQCNATPPANVGFELGGKTFHINPADLIWKAGGETCLSAVTAAVQATGAEEVILGNVFLKNVVAVFDVGKKEMRFAARNGAGSQVYTGLASGSHAKVPWIVLMAIAAVVVGSGIVN